MTDETLKSPILRTETIEGSERISTVINLRLVPAIRRRDHAEVLLADAFVKVTEDYERLQERWTFAHCVNANT